MSGNLASVSRATAAGTSVVRDHGFSATDFRRVRELIYKHAGISLAQTKEEMVYSRLVRRLKATGIDSFGEYLDYLQAPGNQAEWEHFTNALTTNLTSFFREAHHFPMLVAHLRSLRRNRPLRVWTCAASTGEEPYSIAIAIAEAFDTLSPPVQIVATDIDTKVLATAKEAVYEDKRIADLPAAQVHRFFQRGAGANAGKVRLRPEIASLVRFKPLNLLTDEWLGMQPFDAIFCRNVMIYFDKPTQYNVLRKLAQLLEPNGLLFAGHSENLSFAADLFRIRSQTVYECVRAANGRSVQAFKEAA